MLFFNTFVNMKRLSVFLLLLCLCIGDIHAIDEISYDNQTSSTSAPAKKRKKVAIVLSGGGAKGVAHIGALKVIERAGIPIDMIVGTSMGSIVGGLYACGNDAHTLDSIVRMQNWSYLLSDREDLSHQSLRDREMQNTYIISKTINIGKKGTKTSEGGFLTGKNLAPLFQKLTEPYNDSIDFNQLPIPFACVATNLVDNTEYVFHSGVLGRAMRASMSIPGAFSPVRIGDMVLVDGGLRNNFPVDIAKEMGADYIIGVNVQNKLRTASELNSTSSVLLQIVDFNCKNKYEQNLDMTDLPIMVNVEGYSSASFSSAAIDTLIHRGEEAAMSHWNDFMELRDLLGEVTESDLHPQIPLKSISIEKRYRIKDVRFEMMSKMDELFLHSKFGLNKGDIIDANLANLVTTSIRMDLFYQSAQYGFTVDPDGNKDEVIVTFTAGTKKNNQVNLGLRFDNEEMVALQANADFPLRTSVPAHVDFTLRLGKRIMARADFAIQPRSYIRPTLSYVFRHNDINLYQKGEKFYNMTYNQHTVELQLINFNTRNFNVNAGAKWDYYHYNNLLVNYRPESQMELFDNEHFFVYQAQVDYNSENHWFIPTKGAKFTAKFGYYTDNFVKLKNSAGMREYSAMWRMSFPVNNILTIQPMLYGRLIFGTYLPSILGNVMGGPFFSHYVFQQIPFPGVAYIERARDKILAAQLMGQLSLTKSSVIQLKFAAAQDAPKVNELLDYRTMLGSSLTYCFNSTFGPLGATVGYSNISKEFYYYVNLGFKF